jgi:predicted transcriptional regulator with HTH domain
MFDNNNNNNNNRSNNIDNNYEQHLLSNMLSSTTTMEVNMLFRKNPNLLESIEGIAKKIGQTRVGEEVNKLVEIGLLQEIKMNSMTMYRINKEMAEDIDRRLVDHFRSAMERRLAAANEH